MKLTRFALLAALLTACETGPGPDDVPLFPDDGGVEDPVEPSTEDAAGLPRFHTGDDLIYWLGPPCTTFPSATPGYTVVVYAAYYADKASPEPGWVVGPYNFCWWGREHPDQWRRYTLDPERNIVCRSWPNEPPCP